MFYMYIFVNVSEKTCVQVDLLSSNLYYSKINCVLNYTLKILLLENFESQNVCFSLVPRGVSIGQLCCSRPAGVHGCWEWTWERTEGWGQSQWGKQWLLKSRRSDVHIREGYVIRSISRSYFIMEPLPAFSIEKTPLPQVLHGKKDCKMSATVFPQLLYPSQF